MSFRIDINTIARLLLQDGVWYEVLPGSFTVDSVEWTDSEGLVVDGEGARQNFVPHAILQQQTCDGINIDLKAHDVPPLVGL